MKKMDYIIIKPGKDYYYSAIQLRIESFFNNIINALELINDDYESSAYHMVAVEIHSVIGTGRLHIENNVGIISQMVVEDSHKKKGIGKFQPRSFNLGLSEVAFSKTNGFSKMKTGEDIDLTFRLWENDLKTQLIEKAFVYHKRRSTIGQFFKQTYSFGTARPILNKKYPETAKITYWFPSLFIIGFDISIILACFGYWQFIAFYGFYFTLLFIDALIQNKNIKVAFLSIITSFTQFIGYGLGFLESKFIKK